MGTLEQAMELIRHALECYSEDSLGGRTEEGEEYYEEGKALDEAFKAVHGALFDQTELRICYDHLYTFSGHWDRDGAENPMDSLGAGDRITLVEEDNCEYCAEQLKRQEEMDRWRRAISQVNCQGCDVALLYVSPEDFDVVHIGSGGLEYCEDCFPRAGV